MRLDNGGMKTATSISRRILALARSEQWAGGEHLAAQGLADRLRVSRQPINDALQLLAEHGIARRERNRGFFLAVPHDQIPANLLAEAPASDADLVEASYFRIAEDRLRGTLPESVTEAALLEPGYRLAPAVLARCRAAEIYLLQGGSATDSADHIHDRGVNFHESLVQASGNAFFIDTIRRVNRVQRLLSYRSMQDRTRYRKHCEQHLHILELLEQERNAEASQAMRAHLASTLRNLTSISDILQPGAGAPAAPSPERASNQAETLQP